MGRALLLAALAILGCAPSARALVVHKVLVGFNVSGGFGSGFTQDGSEGVPVAVGLSEHAPGGACPAPTGPNYTCLRTYSATGMVGGRLLLRADASLHRRGVVGLGLGNSDGLAYTQTEIEIFNLRNSVISGNGFVYFVIGLHGGATATASSAEVDTLAAGIVYVSGIAAQCAGNVCEPVKVPVSFGSSNVVSLRLRVDARAGAPVGLVYDADMDARFGDTMELLAAYVHDENDVLVPGAQVYSVDVNGDPELYIPNVVETTTTTSTLGPGETTTTTLASGATTTTTLPGGCPAGPTYESLGCRLDHLVALVQGSGLGKTGTKLAKPLAAARTALGIAEQTVGGPAKKHRRAVRKALRGVETFGKKIASPKLAKKVPAETLASFAAPVDALRADLLALGTP